MSSLFTHIVSELNDLLYNIQDSTKLVKIDYTDELFKMNNHVTMLNVTDTEITLFPASIVHVINTKDLPVTDVLKTLRETIKNQLIRF